MDDTIRNAITRAIWKTTKGRADDGFNSKSVVNEMDRAALAELKRWKALPDDAGVPAMPRQFWTHGMYYKLGHYQNNLRSKPPPRDDIAAQFSFLDDNIAFDAKQPNFRKFYADLNYYEWMKAIERHDQMMGIEQQRRDAMQSVIDAHPEWAGDPYRKASEILGL